MCVYVCVLLLLLPFSGEGTQCAAGILLQPCLSRCLNGLVDKTGRNPACLPPSNEPSLLYSSCAGRVLCALPSNGDVHWLTCAHSVTVCVCARYTERMFVWFARTQSAVLPGREPELLRIPRLLTITHS